MEIAGDSQFVQEPARPFPGGSSKRDGRPPAQPPYEALARQIGEAAYRTTDAQVADVVRATGSEKAAFEVILAAAVGAGILRWQQATTAPLSVRRPDRPQESSHVSQ